MDRDQLTEHLKFAAELGVDGVSRDAVWRRRGDPGSLASSHDVTQAARDDATRATGHHVGTDPRVLPEPAAAFFRSAADALAAVRADIGDCTRCKLHTQGRKQIVFGVGNPQADLMFVGEAPGADEDIQGIPFVGRAGQLLTDIIEKGLKMPRSEVYIANVIKCRPPQNRNPEPDEVATCEPFLFQQIDAIQPRVIVALGTFAAQALLRTLDPISRLRGRVYDYRRSEERRV